MDESMPLYKDLAGRIAIVTGASTGLGAVMSEALSLQGVRVAGVARSRDRLEAFGHELNQKAGADVFFAVAGDISLRQTCERIVMTVVERFGCVDILINNAGVGSSHARAAGFEGMLKFWDCDPDLWADALSINSAGAFYMAHAAVPHMLKRGWGRIVNNTTNFHTMLGPGRSCYGPGKAALEASTLIWSKELDGTGVTSNVLIPGGPTATPIHKNSRGVPLDQMLKPEIMAPPILWLASRASDGVTGRRFNARLWDSALPPGEAAAKAGQPAAWDVLSTRVATSPQYF
jgi:NAD(P)-dependent dehydrogenase (short-subunit alcohol dehydrogenase family)